MSRSFLATNTSQRCCPWPWSLVVLEDKIVVLGPGLGFEAQVLVNIPDTSPSNVTTDILRTPSSFLAVLD